MKKSVDEYTDEELGAYDEFMSRFARVTDIFLSQLLRTMLRKQDPAFRGTFLDSLNAAEKFGIIDSAEEWYKIRELRNRQAHEYEEEDLLGLYQEVLKQVERVRTIQRVIHHAAP